MYHIFVISSYPRTPNIGTPRSSHGHVRAPVPHSKYRSCQGHPDKFVVRNADMIALSFLPLSDILTGMRLEYQYKICTHFESKSSKSTELC